MAQQSPIKPVLQALVLADHIYTDRDSRKHIIAGTFNRLSAPSLPQTFSRPTYAFICLTDVYGTIPIALRYVDLATNEVLMESETEVTAENPLASIELVSVVPPFPMPHEGTFAFEVHANNELIGFLRVMVTKQDDDQEGIES